MRSINTDPVLVELLKRVLHHAKQFERKIPEIRFFILNGLEFASLLEKKVYPVSPVNIWEGKNMTSRKHRIETGQESSLYYEVVQTGNPSYAYLNDTNSAMTQASVMAHVVGHCEFSEINVLKDSNKDRTELVMYLVKKVNLARQQMGYLNYNQYWNACESLTSMIASSSQFNLENSVESNKMLHKDKSTQTPKKSEKKFAAPHSSTLDTLFREQTPEKAFTNELHRKQKKETINRKGYKLRAPCQDVMGFLLHYAPTSRSEKSVLDYLYTIHLTHAFVMKTQIMNEGWAMFWEKKIMLELFKERAVPGIIDYSKTFSMVCYPRPFFMRNPYHLGYHLWCHLEEMLEKGKVSLDFMEETDRKVKEEWDRPSKKDPISAMGEIVRTVTDYEFLRRFLTPHLIHEFHLNRIEKGMAKRLGLKPKDLIQEDKRFVWVDPEPIKMQMLEQFTHFNRPRIYIVDTDFMDGGLLLYHRNDGQSLKKAWIEPTLKNINYIWRGAIYLYSRKMLYHYSSNRLHDSEVGEITFEHVVERMQNNERPFK
jgi:stage V sporulation protein R